MRPMSKFEKKFGRYAIHNLSTMLIICYAVGYLIQMINPDFMIYLTLSPYHILHGQVWRLVTWVLIPPSSGNIFLVLIMLYFYWSIGSTLERTWGAYRYNVYIFSGMLFTVVGSFLMLGFYYLTNGEALGNAGGQVVSVYFLQRSLFFSTYYINMSIFLAFAATFPEVQVLLMFIVPIKVKWLGFVYAGIMGWDFVTSGSVPLRFAMASSLVNFLVFFITSRNRIISPKQMHRQYEFKKEVKRSAAVTKHKCAICGRTDESNPELEFRFCSKCNGNYEYCQEHLFTHKHVGSYS